jgi:hypothetical protein
MGREERAGKWDGGDLSEESGREEEKECEKCCDSCDSEDNGDALIAFWVEEENEEEDREEVSKEGVGGKRESVKQE